MAKQLRRNQPVARQKYRAIWRKPSFALELEDPESALIVVRTRRTAAELTSPWQLVAIAVVPRWLLNKLCESGYCAFRNSRCVEYCYRYCGAGFGVDRFDSSWSFDLPDSVRSYVHQIGHTGRAGSREGTAISLVQAFAGSVSSSKWTPRRLEKNQLHSNTGADWKAHQIETAE